MRTTPFLAALLLALFTIVSTAPAASPGKAQEPFFGAVKAGSKKATLSRTKTVGAPTGIDYFDTQGDGGIIVGFDFWTSNYTQHLVINGVRPVYQTPKGRVRGKARGYRVGNLITVEAREGFAVSGVTAKAGDRMDRVQVEFMRINYPTRDLDPNSLYKSGWTGGKGGIRDHHLTGGGKLIVGIYGASGDELDRFGLLYLDPK